MSKVVSIAEAKPAENRSAIVDEYGRLTDQLAPLQKREKQLSEIIRGWYRDSDPAVPHSAEGLQYSLSVSAGSKKRSILSLVRLKARLGLKLFIEHCSFSLEKFDQLVPESEHPKFLKVENHGGPRRITVARKVLESEVA